MNLDTNKFMPLIDKEKANIIDIANCVYDKKDTTIRVNDIQGYKVLHFDFNRNLIRNYRTRYTQVSNRYHRLF